MTKHPTEEFRYVEDMFKADQRNLDAPHVFAGQPISIEVWRECVDKYDIPPQCPEDIHVQFDNARNLYLYSWYVFRFTSPAQAQAYATMEFALRTRFKELNIKIDEKRDTLPRLLKKAINKGFLKDGGFPHLEYTAWADTLDPDGTEFCKTLPGFVSTFRNAYAHGGTTLMNPAMSLTALQDTSAIIQQLYAPTEASKS
ncbi:hypothetical protein ACFL12_00425 [Pseudomonadota bacterium]